MHACLGLRFIVGRISKLKFIYINWGINIPKTKIIFSIVTMFILNCYLLFYSIYTVSCDCFWPFSILCFMFNNAVMSFGP